MTRKQWIFALVIWIPIQSAALIGGQAVGRHLADKHSYAKGMCKINGLWNSSRSCREKGVSGNVWTNYDGTYHRAS